MKVTEDHRIIFIIITLPVGLLGGIIFYEKAEEERDEDDYEDSNQTRMNSS